MFKVEKKRKILQFVSMKVIKERDDLLGELDDVRREMVQIQKQSVLEARDHLEKEDKESGKVAELKSQLEEKSASISALEDEIKVLKRKKSSNKKNEADTKEEISNYEIKLLATEEDLEQTKTLLRQEENKTQKQALQVQMMKDRMFKLEEREDK